MDRDAPANEVRVAQQRTVELFTVYAALPTVVAILKLFGRSVPVLPLLWCTAAVAMLIARRDASLKASTASFYWGEECRYLGRRFLMNAVLLTAFTALLRPDALFHFPRHSPALWLLVMVLYPFLSVLPQEFLYRKFFFGRYAVVFDSEPILCFSSAALFGYLHIIFLNWAALALTLVGGVLFVTTYRRTRSLLLVTIEHAVYGCFVITVGFGSDLYDGTIRTVQSVVAATESQLSRGIPIRYVMPAPSTEGSRPTDHS